MCSFLSAFFSWRDEVEFLFLIFVVGFYFTPLPQMTYFLTKQLCSQFQVENLLEEDPDPKKTRELKIYDLFHSDRGQLRRLAEEKKVPIQVIKSFIFSFSKGFFAECIEASERTSCAAARWRRFTVRYCKKKLWNGDDSLWLCEVWNCKASFTKMQKYKLTRFMLAD